MRPPQHPFAEPDTRQLVVLGTMNGTSWNGTITEKTPPLAVKVLHDGTSFVALFDAPRTMATEGDAAGAEAAAGDGVFAARVVDADGEPWAWGTGAVDDTGRTAVPLVASRPRPPGEHRFEAWLLRPIKIGTAPAAAGTGDAPNGSSEAAADDARAARAVLLGTDDQDTSDQAMSALDVLVDPVALWSLPLGFRSSASVALTGPSEGVDRPNAVEGAGVLTVQTGTYEIVVEGRRVWTASLLVELDQSRVHDSAPPLHVNGSRSFEVTFSGHRPLHHWQVAPWTEGLRQSFRLAVEVDWETDQDALEEHTATYFATLQHAYRQDGTAFVAGSAGSQVFVAVRPDDAGMT